jgi:hypothetical protein
MHRVAPAIACLCLLLLLAGVPGDLPPTVLHVPGDSDTIQGAVDLAGPDTIIQVRKGVYTEAVTITGKTNLTLLGKGKPTIETGAANDGITITKSEGIVIQGFVLQSVVSGITIQGSTDVTVTKCRIQDVDVDGVNASDSSFVHVERTTVARAGEDGLDIGDIPGVTDCSAIKNRISDVGNHGVLFGGDRNLAEKNKVSLTGGHGLETRSTVLSNDNVFRNNRVKQAGATGLLANGTGNLFENNKVSVSSDEGLLITETATGNTFRNNKATRAGAAGMGCRGTGNTVTACKLSSSTSHGVEVTGNDNLIELNKVAKAGSDGFHVEGTGNTITGNKAKGSADLDLEDTNGVGPNTYTDNTFPKNNLGL